MTSAEALAALKEAEHIIDRAARHRRYEQIVASVYTEAFGDGALAECEYRESA